MNIKIKNFDRKTYQQIYHSLTSVNTICVAANCPNRYECFTAKTATFLLLGNICTRNCQYCNVASGRPAEVDYDALTNILAAIDNLQLEYIVLTQVTRDDLMDGGASYMVAAVDAIRQKKSAVKLELLISDLGGNWSALRKILQVKPAVLNHNIEVTDNLFPMLRPEGDYKRSLQLLRIANEFGVVTKSGLMVGFGETMADIYRTLQDLRDAGVKIITIGQYMQPNENKVPVVKWYQEKEFLTIEKVAYQMGFSFVAAGTMVRSSYRAKEGFNEL